MKTTINNSSLIANQHMPYNGALWEHIIEEEVARLNMQVLKPTPASPEKQDKKNAQRVKKSIQKSNIYIKNMVSISCTMVVKAVLKKLGVPYTCVELGRVEIQGSLTEIKQEQLKSALLKLGFELMEDRKSVLIEKIKNIIIAMIHSEDELPKTKFSCYLSKELDHNYTYLSNLFSKVKGTTIEHFILSHKIERVKELLIYNELTLSEIAWKLNYSSVAHLSNQFKKITGSTPSHFKNRKRSGLIALENLMNYAE